jgi:hypothetical protein
VLTDRIFTAAEVTVLTFVGTVTAAIVLFSGSLLVWWLTVRRTAQAAGEDQRQRAYADLLVASIGVTMRTYTLLSTLGARSGIREAVAVAVGYRKPIDALELHDWAYRDYSTLMDAWSRTWAYGTPDGVVLSNQLLEACRQVMDVLDLGDAKGGWQKLRRSLLGVEVDGLMQQWNERITLVAVARRDLADHARAETGKAPAELFSTLR